ncbi:DUF4411 family protein [Corynebacterium lowii]|uniref:DUF4411 family protein n=1 Tax=Corynebacterium lowii TaxID=1544413 RepID=UPI0012E27D86|nr:DUF4411 family protein [Corynebacterium lowii]MDP9852301.1 Zn-dependent peptidase ImmA (M78 family) [Corynebacterium lowii]
MATAAAALRRALDFEVEDRALLSGPEAARGYLIDAFEELGGLVVLSSMLRNNTARPLDIEEFRGFTLHSSTAPLVFVNSADTYAGQVFSLLHEFAHVWAGNGGVSAGGDYFAHSDNDAERWCNEVAAEVLVPVEDLGHRFLPDVPLVQELGRLARVYCCSTLVILLRLRDIGLLPRAGFDDLYQAEVDRLMEHVGASTSSGGNFYANQRFRVGATLGTAIVRETLAGHTPMTEALSLLGFNSTNVLINAARLYYSHDIAPRFWDWLVEEHEKGSVASIDRVKKEIAAGKEGFLWSWAKGLPHSFWRKPSDAATESMRRLSGWVMHPDRLYRMEDRNEFLSVADYYLVAQAHGDGHRVVTFEQPAPQARKRVSIPDACAALGVEYVDPFRVYRQLGLKLN